MKRLLVFALLALVLAADPPTVTLEQRFAIVQAQRDLIAFQAEKNALESRLKDLNYVLIPQAQATVQERLKAASPAGWVLQPDLTLKPETKQ